MPPNKSSYAPGGGAETPTCLLPWKKGSLGQELSFDMPHAKKIIWPPLKEGVFPLGGSGVPPTKIFFKNEAFYTNKAYMQKISFLSLNTKNYTPPQS